MADSVSAFCEREFKYGPQLIGRGILPAKAKLVLGAPPKTGKSFLIINIARDLAIGRHLFGAVYANGTPVFPVKKPCRVLYTENEIGPVSLQERLKGLCGDHPAQDIPLFIKSRDVGMRLDTEEGVKLLRREIEEVKPDVVIFDPLAKYNLSDENSAQEMGAVMRQLDHFVADYGVATIVIHHTGHPNPMYPRRGGDKLRGSTAIYGDADTIVTVDRKSSESVREPVLELAFELRCGEPIEPVFVQRLGSGEVVWCGSDFKWSAGLTAGRPTSGARYSKL